MLKETKQCQNCKNEFTIEPEDFDFYEKMKVLPPTFCPECRIIRRMSWRNERTLYHRKCDATGKDIITMFAPEQPLVVYERYYWWSDKWDQLKSGRDYDFSKTFFKQFKELFELAPLPNLANNNVRNSEYGNHNADMKDCYLTYASFTNENTHYSNGALRCKDSMDLYIMEDGEQCYEDVISANLSKVFFAYDSDNSLGSYFLRSCANANNCFGCVNLRNKSYHIWNMPYSKEDYKKEIEKLNLGSYKSLTALREKFSEFSKKFPRRFASIIRSTNSTGDNIMSSKNVHECFDVFGETEDSKFDMHGWQGKDIYDGYGFGGNANLMYELIDTGVQASHCCFAVFTHVCHDTQYTYCCHNSSNLFGCVGLRNKKYCILNKQYTKEEYEALVPKIIEHMNETPYIDVKGRVYKYGEFFPPEISPFAYNETIAQEYFPLTRDEILKRGYTWRDPETKDYKPDVSYLDLLDDIKDISDSILNEVISCAHEGKCVHQCTTAFKIIKDELQFYRKMNLPLPRLCPNCRHYERLAQRNPLKLYHRKCQCAGQKSENGVYQNTTKHSHGDGHCPNEFETPYAPGREEIIYCEQCYQEEVI